MTIHRRAALCVVAVGLTVPWLVTRAGLALLGSLPGPVRLLAVRGGLVVVFSLEAVAAWIVLRPTSLPGLLWGRQMDASDARRWPGRAGPTLVWWRCLGLFVVGMFAFALVEAVSPWSGNVPSLPDEGGSSAGWIGWLFVMAVASSGLAVPVAEELMFRGVVHQLADPYGRVAAVVASSVLFGAAHYMFGWAALAYTVDGLVLVGVYELAGRRLIVPLTVHATVNMMALAKPFVPTGIPARGVALTAMMVMLAVGLFPLTDLRHTARAAD